MEERLVILERTVAQLSGRDLEQPGSSSHEGTQNEEPLELQHESGNDEQQGWEVVIDNNHAPAAIPASYISEISAPSPLSHTRPPPEGQPDMISRNIVPVRNATTLFELYRDRLDQFLYGILGDCDDLSDVRRASPLLTDAVCTVSALHSKSENYAAYRTAFMQQVSAQIFCKRRTLDDVRGLCIGAFWLSDISWSLMGLGKIATCVKGPADQSYQLCVSPMRST